MYGENNASCRVRSRSASALVIVLILLTVTGCLQTYHRIHSIPQEWIKTEGLEMYFWGYLSDPNMDTSWGQDQWEGGIPKDSTGLQWRIGWLIYGADDRWFDTVMFVVDTTMIVPLTSPDTFLCTVPDTEAAYSKGPAWRCPFPTLKELHAEKMSVRMVIREIRLDGSRPPKRIVLDFVAKRWTEHITILSGM
jgi:hypothetical protein